MINYVCDICGKIVNAKLHLKEMRLVDKQSGCIDDTFDICFECLENPVIIATKKRTK